MLLKLRYCGNLLALLCLSWALSNSAEAQCLDSLIDIASKDWRSSRSAPITTRLRKHSSRPSKITIHYTGTAKKPNRTVDQKLNGLFRFSANDKTDFKHNLWGDIPYHYFIDVNGIAAEGRNPVFQPDTNTIFNPVTKKGYNPDGHITIVVEGDANDGLLSSQKQKLFAMIKALQDQYNIPTSEVNTHKHHAGNTDCPGPVISAAVSEYRRKNWSYRPNKACAATPRDLQPKIKPKNKRIDSSDFMIIEDGRRATQ